MNIIGWLLAAYIGLFSAFGSATSSDDVAVEAVPEPSATASPGTSPGHSGPPKGEAGIEERFLTRTPLPTCGMVTPTEQPGQAPPDEVWDCLQRAADTGGGAELIRVGTTPEGNTVHTYYRITPQGQLEMYVDSREDRLAGSDWSYRRCAPSADLRRAPCQGDT